MPGPGHFVDEAVICVRSGRGGDGCVSFHRERRLPRGGPDGGDGGRGGHLILRAEAQISTLLDVGRSYLYAAENGRQGSGRNRTGRSGKDLLVRLPVGTIVRDRAGGGVLVDLDTDGMEWIAAAGGRGGRGNKSYATAVHRAPREWEAGGPGEERELALELKLVADVGLLGLPNAGKSTFLSRVSAAHPRIADYPFTTLTPQLGIAELDRERRIVVADIPGLIEGAHRGVGLGISFLRHLERTRVLVHLLDPHERDREGLRDDHRVIREELAGYSEVFLERPILTVINKIDLLPRERREPLRAALEERVGEPVRLLSAATGEGLSEILEAIWRALHPPAET